MLETHLGNAQTRAEETYQLQKIITIAIDSVHG